MLACRCLEPFKMKLYLKLSLFCVYILLQNVASEDKLTLTDLTNGSPANGTALNSTALFNSSTPVILNCTNGIENSTDLSQCTPINITLSYECTKVDDLYLSLNRLKSFPCAWTTNRLNSAGELRLSHLLGHLAAETLPRAELQR